MLVKGAANERLGKKFSACVNVMEAAALEYSGTKDLEKRSRDPRYSFRISVVVSRNRVMRTRPMFSEWGCTFRVMYDDMERSAIDRALKHAGLYVGLSDFRPQFGRFEVVSATDVDVA